MQAVAVTTPVGRLVADRPERSEVFERFGIDYCCQGRTPLSVACAERGLREADVLEALAEADAQPPDPDRLDYQAMTTVALIDHIVEVHHSFLWQELAPLNALAHRVAAAHQEAHPELAKLAQAFDFFREDLEAHMMKEEKMLFPALRELAGGRELPGILKKDLYVPLLVMEGDHERVEQSIRFFRTLTGGYIAPHDACDAWRALLGRLLRLERDLHRHVHLENEILHIRARDLSRS